MLLLCESNLKTVFLPSGCDLTCRFWPLFAQEYIRHVTVPLLVINSLVDAYELIVNGEWNTHEIKGLEDGAVISQVHYSAC